MRRRQDAPFFKGTFFFAAADQVTPNLRADERCAAGRQKIKWLGERKTGCLLLCRLSDGSLCVVSKSGTGRLFPDGLISSTSLSLFLPNFSDDDKWEASWLHNDTRKIKRCFHFFSHCFSREWELLCTITFPTPAQKGRGKRCATYFGADGDRVTFYLHGQQLTSGQKRGEKIRKEPPPQIAEPLEEEIGGSSPLQNFFVDCDVTMTTRGDSL